MTLNIITPEKTLYSSENATSVICPGMDGAFQLMNNHSAIVSALKKGKVIVADSDHKALEFPIASGLVECSNNVVNVMVEENQ